MLFKRYSKNFWETSSEFFSWQTDLKIRHLKELLKNLAKFWTKKRKFIADMVKRWIGTVLDHFLLIRILGDYVFLLQRLQKLENCKMCLLPSEWRFQSTPTTISHTFCYFLFSFISWLKRFQRISRTWTRCRISGS